LHRLRSEASWQKKNPAQNAEKICHDALVHALLVYRPEQRVRLAPCHTRRALLFAAVGACAFAAKPSDFWNKEDPARWTSAEIQRLLTDSPWAKGIDVHLEGEGPGANTERSSGRLGRSANTSVPNPELKPKFPGTVRWASAKPILTALKMELPHELAGHYVISVSGVPVISGTSADDSFDALKQVSFLQMKGKDAIQPGIIQAHPDDTSTVLFGFLPSMVDVSMEKAVNFSTKLGPLDVRAKFNLKEMRYRGELSL
jgi:hypothetical protein